MALHPMPVLICVYLGFLHYSYSAIGGSDTNGNTSYYVIRSMRYNKKTPSFMACVVLDKITMTTLSSIRFRRRAAYLCNDHHMNGVACLSGKPLAIWIDEINGEFMTASYPSTWNTSAVLLHRGFGSVNRIVVDWISYNVYWADSMYEWIAMKSVWSRDERGFRVVQDTWMTDVWSLTIAPTRRFLFWASNSKDAAIVRSSLTGSESRSIVWRGVNNVTAMAFDDISGRVYWASATWRSVQSCDADGGNRRVFRTGQRSFNAITIASPLNLLIATSTSTSRIFFYKTTNGQEMSYSTAYRNGAIQNDISFCQDRERDAYHDNPCLNRGCQHICVVEKNNSTTCLCHNGFRMHENGVNCTAEAIPRRSIIVVNGSHLCSFDISANINLRPMTRYQSLGLRCHNAKSSNLRYLAVDSNGGRLFYVSMSAIVAKNMSSGKVSELVRNVSNIKGLTYDWLRGTLYWIEGGHSRDAVRYTDHGNQGQVTDLLKGTIADITLDPFHRYLYVAYGKSWLNDDVTGPAVYRISLDRGVKAPRHMHVRVFHNVNHNSRIYYDAITSRSIIWPRSSPVAVPYYLILRVYLSSHGQLISTPSVSGPPSLQRSVHRGSDLKSIGLVVYKKYIVAMMDGWMWINDIRNTQKSLYKKTSELGKVANIAVYDPATQPDDVDPCLVENGGCQQLCVKMRNGRQCGCYLGFNKSVDSSNGRVICRSNPVLDRFLLLADTYGGYYQLSLDNLSLAGIHSTGQQSYQYTSLAYSAKTKRVYWSHEKTIGGRLDLMSSTLNGSDISTAINIGIAKSISLVAIDQSTGNIYIVKDTKEMFVHSHNGQNGKPITINAKFIYSIALHPKRGVMYLSVMQSLMDDRIDVYSIGKSNMDGSNFKILINALSWGVALDYDSEKLYWSDFQRHAIFYAGRNNRQHLVCKYENPYSLAVFGAYVYFAATSTSGILRAPKLGGRAEIVAASAEMGMLQHLGLYDSHSQQENKACSRNNGRCSALCLPTASGHTCACSPPYDLEDDGRTCSNVRLCDPSIRRGYIASDCTHYPGSRCRFFCNSGYKRNHLVLHEFLECKLNGNWNVSTDTLCWKYDRLESSTRSSETPGVDSSLAIVYGVFGVVMVAVAAIAIKLALPHRRKNRKSESGREAVVMDTLDVLAAGDGAVRERRLNEYTTFKNVTL